MKKILIAVDYDPTAQKVAEAGHSLARAMGAEVILLHVVRDLPDYYSRGYSTIMGFSGYGYADLWDLKSPEDLVNSSREYLDKIKVHLKDDKIETVIREGDAADVILKTAEEYQVDLIVIGSHSRRGLDKILMGSVAESVLHHCHLPMYIIPVKEPK
jgi:nucleotide-binding universal stress UspA family protein